MNISFLSDNLKLSGVIFTPLGNTNSPGVLFLHGGGKDGTHNFVGWQHYLAENGYSSMFFYFRGCGKSDGNFSDSSLSNRLTDAKNAFLYYQLSGLVDPNKICVLGSSMGGHIAARLTEKIPGIASLILYGAAAYGENVEKLPLHKTFTSEIRKPLSWKNSPAFTAISKFTKPVLLIYGQNDTVIPTDVKVAYSLSLTKQGLSILIPEGGHQMLTTDNKTEQTDKLYRASITFLHFVFYQKSL